MSARVPPKRRVTLPRDLHLAKLAIAAKKKGFRTRSYNDLRRAVMLFEKAAKEAETKRDFDAARIFAADAGSLRALMTEIGPSKGAKKGRIN
ncbi:MAG: hypothetical protein AABW59_03860 [archaeon]